MVAILRNLGYRFDIQEVSKKPAMQRGRPHGQSAGEKGYLKQSQKYLPTIVDCRICERFKLTPARAIEAIHNAGGIVLKDSSGLVDNDELLHCYSCRSSGFEVYGTTASRKKYHGYFHYSFRFGETFLFAERRRRSGHARS